MHIDRKFTFESPRIPFVNQLVVVKLHSRILLNIKLSRAEFTAFNSSGPFKHLVAIEREGRDSENGSSRSRALVGLSRGVPSISRECRKIVFRTYVGVRFNSSLFQTTPSVYHRWHKGYDQVPTPLIGSPLHRSAPLAPRYLLFRFISNVYPISTSYWRSRLNSHEDPFLFARVKGKWKYPRQSRSP